MFKSLRLENFKSHEDSLIHFDKGITVIFGISQSGKTNFVRGLRKLIYNRPLGGKFFSDFAGSQGKTKITLSLEGSPDISNSIDVKVNKKGEKEVIKSSYSLGDLEFTGLRDQVPDQIIAALNISELNIQRQFDAPFLIMSAPGEIAKTINRITKLEEVDEWISELTSKINLGNRDVIRMESEAKSLVQSLEIYKDINQTEIIIQELCDINQYITKLESQQEDLTRTLSSFEEKEQEYNKIKEYLLAEKYIVKAEKIQSEIDQYETLKELLANYENQRKSSDKTNQQLKELLLINNNLSQSEYSSDEFDQLQTLLGSYSKLSNQSIAISKLLTTEKIITEADTLNEVIILWSELKDALKDYERIKESNFEIGIDLDIAKQNYINKLKTIGKCPTCFASMDKVHINKIKEDL